MTKNIGTTDRIIRLSLAALILVVFFTDQLPGTVGIIALVIAGVLAFTAIVRFCPAYYPFRISTLFKKR